MLDLRSHLLTIVAVFCALGIGLLMGTILSGDDVLLEKQRQLIDKLEDEFNGLRRQNENYRRQITALEGNLGLRRQFEDQLLPLVTQGLLAERKVFVIQLGGQGINSDLSPLLTGAGAQVVGVMTMIDLPFPAEEKARRAILARLGQPTGSWTQLLPELARVTAQDLIWSWHSAAAETAVGGGGGEEAGNLLAILTELNAIALSQQGAGDPDSVIVLAAGEPVSQIGAQYFFAPLAQALDRERITVVGAEQVATHPSLIPVFKEAQIPTVDNVDTAAGRMALVIMLAAGVRGHFGVKATAEGIMPSVTGLMRPGGGTTASGGDSR